MERACFGGGRSRCRQLCCCGTWRPLAWKTLPYANHQLPLPHPRRHHLNPHHRIKFDIIVGAVLIFM